MYVCICVVSSALFYKILYFCCRHVKEEVFVEVVQSLWSHATALSRNGQLMNC